MKILIAGDYVLRGRALTAIERGEDEIIWGKVPEILSRTDYSICNFEAPVLINGLAKPITKNGPALKHSPLAVKSLKQTGFDCVTLANNHFYDYGEIGIKNTFQTLKSHNIEWVGGGKNISEASKIIYKQITDIKIALINACEHEFSIATQDRGGSNPLDIIQQTRDILEAKKNADYVIMILHGGSEYYQYPTSRMVKTYRYFIDMGADFVINHHQHCFSGFEKYGKGMIFYGLGNLCFDSFMKVADTWNYGYMVELNLEKDSFSYKLIPYRQCAENPGIEVGDFCNFDKSIKSINEVIADENKLNKKFDELTRETVEQTIGLFVPYTGKLYALWRRNLLPSFISKRKLVNFLNKVDCESHRDRLVHILKSRI